MAKDTAHKNKIQQLLIAHLQEYGSIELNLPDRIKLQIGITQEDEQGTMVKTEDYCWASISHDENVVSLDSYNLNLKFENKRSIIMFDNITQDNGVVLSSVSVF